MRAAPRRGWAYSPWGFIRRVYIGAYQDNIPFLASALSFDALLAAIPFILLVLATFGYIFHAGDNPTAEIHALFSGLLPTEGESPSDQLRRVEQLVTDVVESRAQLSVVGLPFFLWFATRLFSGARAALNEVFDTEESRSFFAGKGIDLLMVLVSLVLVLGNAVITVVVAGFPWLGRFLAALTTFSVGVLMFFVVYTVLPSRPVRWDTALVAAAVASLGFEVAKKLFGLYLTEFTTIDRLISHTNAIAILLFVVWIFCVASVFLLGGEVAETYDLMRRQREQRAILA